MTTARASLTTLAVALTLVVPQVASAGPTARTSECGLIKVGAHHYFVLAYKVSCSLAEKTATKLIPLKPKPLTPGAKTGSLPSPKGLKCIATIGPGNSKLQFTGGCAKGGVPVIQWQRAN